MLFILDHEPPTTMMTTIEDLAQAGYGAGGFAFTFSFLNAERRYAIDMGEVKEGGPFGDVVYTSIRKLSRNFESDVMWCC